jgi:3-oxoacyl-[acyl-carrier protein] reductase
MMSGKGILQGQVAVVTGGSGGIGSAICRRLAAEGADVVLTYHSGKERAREVASTLVAGNHMVAEAAVDDSQALKALAVAVEERYGRLDLLVNNAGITRPVPHDDLEGLDDELIDRIFQVNWRGAFAAVRAFKALLESGSGGVIVNISSVAGRTGEGSNVAYCASKAAMDSMTRSLARALAPRIRVVSVSPGWVLGEYSSRMDPAILEAQRQRTPLKQLAEPEVVADAVVAATTLLSHTTGAVIPVDGGRPLG